MIRYYSSVRASFRPEDFELQFAVRSAGVLVGTQALHAHDFAVTRTAEPGSWLGRVHQGRGTGTRMRRAVCAFAFDHLGATEVTSGAFQDDPASLAVNRKVGYRPNGIVRLKRRDGEMALNQELVLTPRTSSAAIRSRSAGPPTCVASSGWSRSRPRPEAAAGQSAGDQFPARRGSARSWGLSRRTSDGARCLGQVRPARRGLAHHVRRAITLDSPKETEHCAKALLADRRANRSDRCADHPGGDVMKWSRSPHGRDAQSSAFSNAPGMERLYSGVTNGTASAAVIAS